MTTVRELPLVLQLDVSGISQQWISYETACYHEAKGNVIWSMGETEYDIHGGVCAATGERSKLTINTIIAVNGKLSPKAMEHYNRVPLSNRTLFRRDQNVCAYCGSTVSASQLTRDHIHPTSRGGKNVWMNVVTACSSCNKVKDDQLLEEAGMELLYLPYVPNRAEWLILQNRKILSDQMEFLLKQVPKDSRLRQ